MNTPLPMATADAIRTTVAGMTTLYVAATDRQRAARQAIPDGALAEAVAADLQLPQAAVLLQAPEELVQARLEGLTDSERDLIDWRRNGGIVE